MVVVVVVVVVVGSSRAQYKLLYGAGHSSNRLLLKIKLRRDTITVKRQVEEISLQCEFESTDSSGHLHAKRLRKDANFHL